MAKYLVVEREKVRSNIKKVRQRAGSATVYGVLKGNAYGFGLLEMADMLRDEGISHFAITEPRDLVILRNSGFVDEEVLVMRSTSIPEEIEKIIEYNGVATIGSYDAAVAINGIAEKNATNAEAHIEIDTGMGRYGFLPGEMDKLLHIYSYMDGLDLCGIYTHFHSAFCNKKATDLQMVSFRSVIRQLQEKGFDPGVCHCCNSAGLLRFPNYAMDAVRVGSAILGRLSFKGSYNLKRVGTLEATIDELRWLPKGHTCGYGAGWRAKKPTRIAVLPVGWYNGFGCQMGNDLTRRKDSLRGIFSNLRHLIFGRKGYSVLLGGKRCRVLGHIGMLHTVVDVTNVNCKLGDKAVFDVNPLMLKGVDVVFQ